MDGILILWRLWVFMLWLGALIAVLTIVIALGVVLVVGAVVMGLTMPSRTIRGQLASVVLNFGELVDRIRALRPS
jgi:hypothetical protein